MINWLVQQSLVLSVLVLLLIALRAPLNRFIGSRGSYALWGFIPLALLFSLMPSSSVETLPVMEAFSGSTGGEMLNSIQVSSSSVFEQLWLIWPIGSLIVFLALCRVNIGYLKGLNISKEQQVIKGLRKGSSDQLNSPILVGLLQPMLVLPADFTTKYNSQQQDLMIEHELVHKRQGDLLWNHVAVLLLCLFWFNPIIWFGYKYFRLQQELSCDEKVLALQSIKQRQCYAHALVQASSMSNITYLTHATYGGKTMLKERIMKLGQIKSGSRAKTTLCAAVLTGMVGFMQLAVADTSFDSGAADSPTALKRAYPDYPHSAKEQGASGMVQLSFQVGEDGKTTNIKVVKTSSGQIFQSSAIAAVTNWQYKQSQNLSAPIKVQFNFGGYASPFAGIETIAVQ